MGSHASHAVADDEDDAREHDAKAVMVALRRIVRHLRLADREAERTLNLSAAQLFVLHALASSPAASLVELARRR